MLTRNDILEKLKDILLTMDPTKKEKIDSVNEETRLVEDLGLTSVAMLYIVVAIEETFEIQFDDLGIEDFKTIGNTIDYIEKSIK